jgi:four helix bundle protein
MIDEGYQKLDVYKLSHELAIKIHEMTMSLPKFEMYEEGSQIRRSAKSVPANIVEGYCLRKHKNEFLLYLNRSYASAEETIEHLDILSQTKSLKDDNLYKKLRDEYETFCKMLFKFIQSVIETHDKPLYLHEDDVPYQP